MAVLVCILVAAGLVAGILVVATRHKPAPQPSAGGDPVEPPAEGPQKVE